MRTTSAFTLIELILAKEAHPMRILTLALALTLVSAMAHANPWAANYDTLCLADPYVLFDQETNTALAEHAHTLTTTTLDRHGISYHHGTCDNERSFTLLVSILAQTSNDYADVTFGLHAHAPELYDALQHLTIELHQITDDADFDALDAAFAIIDAYSVHIDFNLHPAPSLDALLEHARPRHQWLLDSFALSWLGEN